MLELTFGEQVKIVLNRKDMTIKQLAEMIEERTGKKMSRRRDWPEIIFRNRTCV